MVYNRTAIKDRPCYIKLLNYAILFHKTNAKCMYISKPETKFNTIITPIPETFLISYSIVPLLSKK